MLRSTYTLTWTNAYIHTYIYACIFSYIHMHREYIDAHIYTYTHTCTYAYINAYIPTWNINTHIHVHVHRCTHIYVHANKYIDIHNNKMYFWLIYLLICPRCVPLSPIFLLSSVVSLFLWVIYVMHDILCEYKGAEVNCVNVITVYRLLLCPSSCTSLLWPVAPPPAVLVWYVYIGYIQKNTLFSSYTRLLSRGILKHNTESLPHSTCHILVMLSTRLDSEIN